MMIIDILIIKIFKRSGEKGHACLSAAKTIFASAKSVFGSMGGETEEEE